MIFQIALFIVLFIMVLKILNLSMTFPKKTVNTIFYWFVVACVGIVTYKLSFFCIKFLKG